MDFKITNIMKVLFNLLLIFLPLLMFSQTNEIKLKLNFHDGSGPFEYVNFPLRWDDTSIIYRDTYSRFKSFPKNLKDVKKGIILFDRDQFILQNYIEGNIDKNRFMKIFQDSDKLFKMKRLVKRPIKCFVSIISGLNENHKMVYVLDKNNNLNFSDDEEFVPISEENVSGSRLDNYLKKVTCQRVLFGNVINDSVGILLVMDGNSIRCSVAQYATTILNYGGKTYSMAVCPLYFFGRTWKASQLVLLKDRVSDYKAPLSSIIREGDFLTIGGNVFKYKGVIIENNQLIIEKISEDNQHSSQIGFHAPLFNGIDVVNGKRIELKTINHNKFVFIDFWGTWCKPCRAQIPYLVELKNQVDSARFTFLSVAAFDDPDSLKKVICKEKMFWPQLLSDKITTKYKINSFPSNFLIDPNGVIIGKNISLDQLKSKIYSMGLTGTNF